MNETSDQNHRREFARSAAYRAEQMRFFRETDRRHKEGRSAERVEEDIADLAVSAVLATEVEIATFHEELDAYRAATVESLLENEQRLTEVRARLDSMLAQAYVLPDGRRVFKTRDGLRVFDEDGHEVGPDVIDPDMIDDWRPPADDYVGTLKLHRDLLDDRDRNLDLLDHIDAMDDRTKDGDLTVDDLADMRAELEALASDDINGRVLGDGFKPPLALNREFGNASAGHGARTTELSADEIGFDL